MTTPSLPPFPALVAHFPNMLSVVTLKRLIGGGADDLDAPPGQQWLGGANGDTCTLRMSRAFNYAGLPIPANDPALHTVKGSDHLNYAFRMQELHQWMLRHFGKPDVAVRGKPADRAPFQGKKGVILFDIKFGMNADGVTRAMGHADLWDGSTFFDEIFGVSSPERDFFDIADGVSLWLASGDGELPPPPDA